MPYYLKTCQNEVKSTDFSIRKFTLVTGRRQIDFPITHSNINSALCPVIFGKHNLTAKNIRVNFFSKFRKFCRNTYQAHITPGLTSYSFRDRISSFYALNNSIIAPVINLIIKLGRVQN